MYENIKIYKCKHTNIHVGRYRCHVKEYVKRK